MSINLVSTPSIIKVGPRKGKRMYTTRVAHYSTIDANAVIDYASEIGLLPRGILRAAWDVLGDVIQQLVLHGHIVQIPGVGNIRAEVRAKAQALAADVTPECVTHRKLMLTPNAKLRSALKRTPMTVTVIEEPEEHEVREAPVVPQTNLPPLSPETASPAASVAPIPSSEGTILRSADTATHITDQPDQNKVTSLDRSRIVAPRVILPAADNTLFNKSPPQDDLCRM